MIHITQDSHLGKYKIPDECKKNVLVDVGANTGNFTISQIGKFDLIHFYEPYLPCFETVKTRLGDSQNVFGFNEAVYSEDNLKIPMMCHTNRDAGSNALKTEELNDHWTDELESVTTVSFETILKRVGGHINYLKIDCETSEYKFLLNKNLKDVDYIGIELHWQMGEEKYKDLINHIRKTHTSNDNIEFKSEFNKEVLFKNKNL